MDPSDESSEAPCTREQFLTSFHDAILGMGLRILFGLPGKLLPKANYKKAVELSHKFLDFYINQALEKDISKSGKSNTSKFGSSRHTNLVQGVSAQTDDRIEIRSQILQGILASQETTSVLLGNTFFLLSRNPSAWQQIRTEVLEKGVDLLTFDGLQSCQVIQNILSECKPSRLCSLLHD